MARAAIIGVGETPFRFRRDDATVVELAQEAARAALADAGMTFDEIDAVVFSMGPTGLFGINAVEKWAVNFVGGVNKPFMRIHTGGATGGSAAQAGYFHVASGMFDTVLVVGADKVSENLDAQQILNMMWDPVYEQDFGLNAINMCAFQAVRHMHMYGTTEEQMARVAVRCRRNALNNPYAHLKGNITVEEVLESRPICWPIKLYDACPRSSGGCAIVIASDRTARERGQRPAWINGVGATTNTLFMGDKMGPRAITDHGDWDDLAMAAARAYRQAGITDPRKQIDVAEIYAPFSNMEIAAVEALGFVPKGQGGRAGAAGMFDMDGEIPVSPSGGTLCANPIAVTALVRVADAALQVMGKADGRQVPNVRNAVATGVGGSIQFQTCMVLGSEPSER